METAFPNPATTEFPPRIEMVRAEERFPETFGLMPGVIGAALVWCCVHFLLEGGLGWRQELLLGLGCAIGGLSVLYEGWRRLNQLVLVPGPSSIGVYRRGDYSYTFTRGEVTRILLRKLNTMHDFLVLIAVGMLVPVLLILLPGTFAKLFALALFVGLVASAVHTRLRCHHFYVPRRNSRFMKELLMARKTAERIFPSEG
jgi:hypothetical protein